MYEKSKKSNGKGRRQGDKILIGRTEWCGLPELGLPAVKARIDTGAKTSALHAYDIETFEKAGQTYVRFKIHPLQRNSVLVRVCEAPIIKKKVVISSNGEREQRYVIKTPLVFPVCMILAVVTLTSRHKMRFRMLLGREALKKARFIVDPSKYLLLGSIEEEQSLYE